MGRTTSLLVWLAAVPVTGCAVPFSEMQSARLAGVRNVEVTPTYGYVRFTEDSTGAKVQDEFGVAVATGLTQRIDLRARYIRAQVPDENGKFGVNVLGLGPKVSLVKDRIAFNLPLGTAWGADLDANDNFQLHPTLIGTFPIVPMLDVSASAKAMLPLTGDDKDAAYAVNVGVGISAFDRWTLRPEAGTMWNPGEKGRLWHFGVGLSGRLRK